MGISNLLRVTAARRSYAALNRGSALFVPQATVLFTKSFHDDLRWRAGGKLKNVVKVHPAASGDLITRASFGSLRDIAKKDMMKLL